MQELELEKTYLARYLPDGISDCEHKELLDIYIPESSVHPVLRIRRKGSKYEITKKTPLANQDASQHMEHTISLDDAEFKALATVVGKRIRKIRYQYSYQGRTAEIDVFQDDLAGLVLVDFEFSTVEDMRQFQMPDFCLVDVTEEEFVAGGMLCGKKYSDIAGRLAGFKYVKILK
jgi:CYTH domain-containing protein